MFLLNRKSVALLLVAGLLVGSVIGYSASMLWTDIQRLKDAYEQLVKYFFIQNSNFTIPLDENPYWNVEDWHGNPDSISKIENGLLHLFYNETKGDWFGNSGVYQGKHPDGRYTQQLCVGRTSETANFSDYVVFPKSMMNDKFRLKAKFRILKMGFNRYPKVLDPNARVNLGITLMCAINDDPFNVEAQTLWLDVYFAGYSLNENDIWVIHKDDNYTASPADIHAGYFVDEVDPSDFGKWHETSIDLGDYISKTLNLLTETDIKTIRVYGFIVFVESLGAYAEVEYDYVETYRK